MINHVRDHQMVRRVIKSIYGKRKGTQIIGMKRLRATSTALITLGTMASPSFTRAGL